MIGKRLKTANKIARRLYKIYQDESPAIIGKYRKLRKPCSCFMCGNPRKHFKLKTIQELKAEEKFKKGD